MAFTTIRKQTVVGLLALAAFVLVGYAFGRYVQPARVVTETKEIVKTVEVVKHDTTTKTHEVKHPDGTVETDTTVVNRDTDISGTSSKSESKTIVDNTKPQWKVSGLAGYNFSTYEKVYGAEVDRRILGPIFVGAWGNTQHTGGLSVSIEF